MFLFAKSLQLNSFSSLKPMVHEYFGFVRFVIIVLSNPPLKKVPTGTSEIFLILTESSIKNLT